MFMFEYKQIIFNTMFRSKSGFVGGRGPQGPNPGSPDAIVTKVAHRAKQMDFILLKLDLFMIETACCIFRAKVTH